VAGFSQSLSLRLAGQAVDVQLGFPSI